MKNWLVVLGSMCLLTACSSSKLWPTDDRDFYAKKNQEREEIDSYDLPKHAIGDVVKGLAYQMLESSSFVTPKTPIAVTSFVKLKDLESTNWLGNQLAENFVHELQRHGMVVVDFKTTGAIRVTPDGDFVFTRDWKELPERQIIDYVVSGTMTTQENGVMVNARMIGMQSRVVVASAQSFIPNWVIGEDMSQRQNVHIKDGMIIRDNKVLESEKRAVKIKE